MKHGLRGEPEIGKWDYDGQFAPIGAWKRGRTFSVGIFQWVATAYARQMYPCDVKALPLKHLKRGKVICRVKGLTTDPEKVYEMAERLCYEFENGLPPTEHDNKSYTAERRAK